MNIYIISAESYRIINKELKKIVKDNPVTSFNMNKTTIKEIVEEANYFSFDPATKYLVVSNADFLSSEKLAKEDSELLEKYISNQNPNTILIFTTLNTPDMRKKIVKIIKDNKRLIYIPKMDKKAINDLITNYLKQYDYRIDYNTASYIINNSYNNVDIIYNELDKIMLYYNKPCLVKYDDVIKIVGHELDSNSYHFINAVIEKNMESALKILKDLKVYKVESTSLVILLAREYRLMYYVKRLTKEMNIKELCNYLSLQDWQINKLYNNSIKYNEKELLQNIVNLCNIDLNIKKGIYDKDIALYGFILDVCN